MPVIELVIKQKTTTPLVEIRNVFHLEGPTIGPSEIEAWGQAVCETYVDHMGAMLANEWQVYGYVWRNVSVAQSQGVEVFITPEFGLSAAVQLLPIQVAGLVSFRTGTPPPNQGRKYVAGIIIDAVQNGEFTAINVGRLQAWGDALIGLSPALGGDADLGVARIDPQTGLATDFNPYVTAIARNIPATQRRRRPGVGI